MHTLYNAIKHVKQENVHGIIFDDIFLMPINNRKANIYLN